MMFLAERRIDALVPEELRVAYRILKNAGSGSWSGSCTEAALTRVRGPAR
jgi:hypothetical protein